MSCLVEDFKIHYQRLCKMLGGGREGGKEGEREGGREGGRERGREGGREGEREGGGGVVKQSLI